MKNVYIFTIGVLGLLLLGSSFLIGIDAARIHLSHINSDMLYSLSLYRDMFEARSASWWGWVLTPAPYFVPDLLGLFVLFPWVADPGLGFTLYEIVLLGGLAALLARLFLDCGATGPEALALAGVGLILPLVFLSIYMPAMLEFWLFPTNHGGGLILGLLFFVLLIAQKSRLKALSFVCFLMAFSDSLLLMQWVMPLWIAIYGKHRYRSLGLPSVLNKQTFRVTLVGTVAGIALQKLFALVGMFKYGDGKSLLFTNVRKSFRLFWQDLPALAGVIGFLLAVCALWGLIGYGRRFDSAASRSEKGPRGPAINLLILLTLLCSVASLVGPVLNGAYRGLPTIRYMIPFFVLPLMLTPVLWLAWIHGKAGTRRRYFALAFAVSALALSAIPLRAFFAKEFDATAWHLPYPADVACIDALVHGKTDYRAVSDYWPAKYIQELSKHKITMRQVTKDLKDYYWITNPIWHEAKPDNHGFGTLDFIIANSLMEENLSIFGAPARTELCGDLKVYFYR